MKILTVIGARPQFVKAAVLSRLIRNKYSSKITEILLHTGQHYDANMSDIFFQEMDIPRPHYNLNISGGSHGKMTGRMLEAIEEKLLEHKPDYCLVYGDTNSTAAGALAAAKLHIPVVHVEAGLRSFNRRMPEELNRVITDHISDLLLCPTETAVTNLAEEGIEAGVHLVGDIMLDASLYYRTITENSTEQLPKIPDNFYLITLHRAENTDDKSRLASIVNALNEFRDIPGVLPLHPRTKKMLEAAGLSLKPHIQVIPPQGYLNMIQMENRCRFILTDSGGVQKEAWFFQKPCITMRDQTEWVETVSAGGNTLAGADKEKIIQAIHNVMEGKAVPRKWPSLYGSGNTGREILEILLGAV